MNYYRTVTRKSTPPSAPKRTTSTEVPSAELDNSLEQLDTEGVNGGGSNGSQGWSDLGDSPVEGEAGNEGEDSSTTGEKTDGKSQMGSKGVVLGEKRGKKWSSAELLEIARLKGELRKTETERDTLRFDI